MSDNLAKRCSDLRGIAESTLCCKNGSSKVCHHVFNSIVLKLFLSEVLCFRMEKGVFNRNRASNILDIKMVKKDILEASIYLVCRKMFQLIVSFLRASKLPCG